MTGTRGKSSITRLITSSLREAGFRVLAKTTGSRPVVIYPNGEEKEINRRGSPSVLEGKKVLKLSEKLKIDVLVSEMMSIHPECGYIESVHMFNPHVLVITNVRLDHIPQMGSLKEEIACCFASYIPRKSTVFVLEEEFFQIFQKRAEEMNSRLIKVTKDFNLGEEFPLFEFEENIRLTLAVNEFLGIDKNIAIRGMVKTRPDFGKFRVWVIDFDSPPHSWYLVNCFAVNDPESTRKVLSRLFEKKLLDKKKITGILNLRQDRGDRTIQWLKALREGIFPEFRKLFLIGNHAHAMKRKLKLINTSLFVLRPKNPQKIMEEILAAEIEDTVLIGIGNIGGIGKELVSYWDKIGRPYDF